MHVSLLFWTLPIQPRPGRLLSIVFLGIPPLAVFIFAFLLLFISYASAPPSVCPAVCRRSLFTVGKPSSANSCTVRRRSICNEAICVVSLTANKYKNRRRREEKTMNVSIRSALFCPETRFFVASQRGKAGPLSENDVVFLRKQPRPFLPAQWPRRIRSLVSNRASIAPSLLRILFKLTISVGDLVKSYSGAPISDPLSIRICITRFAYQKVKFA